MIRLFTSYYKDKNGDRQSELDFCLGKNIKNTFLDEIIILSETDDIPFTNDKLKVIPHKRPTFGDFFKVINSIVSDNDINILTNSDIFVDSSVEHLEKMLYTDILLSLLRWEYNNNNPKIEILRSDCQDSWIWRGRMNDLDYDDFFMGKLGCDNRIAWELQNKGYKLKNPTKIIKTYHVHDTNIRNYKVTKVGDSQHGTNKDVIPKPYYYIKPI